MFHVLVPTANNKFIKISDLHEPLGSREAMAGLGGAVTYDRVAVFAHLAGRRVRCATGHLWVTVEGDPEDHVLGPGEGFRVVFPGKVVIGGRGSFCI